MKLLVTSCCDVCIMRKSGISCKMLLKIFGPLWNVKVTYNCQTIFSLHLQRLIASQKECRDIKLAFFEFIRSANKNIWSSPTFIIVMTYIYIYLWRQSLLLLQPQFLILQYVSILGWLQSTCCKSTHCDVTTGTDTWRDKAVNRYQQQQKVQCYNLGCW